jgi:hypothetical protein
LIIRLEPKPELEQHSDSDRGYANLARY